MARHETEAELKRSNIMKFCAKCDNIRWVCEAHPDRPIFGNRACPCGAPGEPCPACNRTELGNPDDEPAMPDGFVFDTRRPS